MKIVIENTSSPGASFTDNTNSVLLKINDWISAHKDEYIKFIDFRSRLERDKGINDNNNRNIFPLLRNCGFVQYESGGSLYVKDFFTDIGKAYVIALIMKQNISTNSQYTKEEKAAAISKANSVLADIVYKGLLKLIKNEDTNYQIPLKEFIKYISEFGSISKVEYAYFLHKRKTLNLSETLADISKDIDAIRDNQFDLEIEVSVRNDTQIREETNKERRKEPLSYLTSYGYFSSLLCEAGLIIKGKKANSLVESRKKELMKLLEGNNE